MIGGAARADSVRNGLQALAAEAPDVVLVHDAARPFVTRSHVAALLAALEGADGAVPTLPVADTLKRAGPDGSLDTVPRDGLHRVQTPQAFPYQGLVRAYAAWQGSEPPTDEAVVVERAGGRVVAAAGDPMLMKLTYPEDFAMAEALAAKPASRASARGWTPIASAPGTPSGSVGSTSRTTGA